MTGGQLDCAKAACTLIVAIGQKVAAAEAQRARFGARAAESTS